MAKVEFYDADHEDIDDSIRVSFEDWESEQGSDMELNDVLVIIEALE